MNRIKNKNIAGKISELYDKFSSDKIASFFTWVTVILIVVVGLFVAYMLLLENADLDVTWHEDAISMKSTEAKNIPASDIPSVSTGQYTLSTWFAVDKSQYTKTQTENYSHLISYGHTTNESESISTFAVGVWLDNGTNNLYIVYKTDDDTLGTLYDPNSSNFNCTNTITVKNYLLNEWNLLNIVVDVNVINVYLNGKFLNAKVHDNMVQYDQNYPSLDICVAMDSNIEGVQKSIRFRNKACNADELKQLYFMGPKKFVLPDIRGKNYIADVTNPNIFAQLGSRSTVFLDNGADIIDNALSRLDTFFRSL